MASFFQTPRQADLSERIRKFLEEEIYPIEKKLLQLPGKEAEILLQEKRTLAKETGAWNLYLPESLGGPGLTLTEIAQLGELLGTTPYGHYVFNCQAPDAGNVELLHAYADETIAEKYLQPLLDGEIRSCFAMTEPQHAGSNPLIMSTIARREGEEYQINGRKWFTTGADGADFAIVMCITDPDAENPYQRAGMIIVPTNTPGFQINRNIPVMGHAGEGWASHSEVSFDNVVVPAKNLLGPAGGGFRLAQERLGPGRIHHCMRWIGIAERCFDLMCRRAASRELSPGKPLAHKQIIQQWIADSRAEIDAARHLVLHTAYEIQTHGQKEARDAISAIKFFAADMLQKVIDRSLQTHGAYGLTDDCLVSFYYREERAARIYDGTDETHKAALAKRILKRYGVN